MAFNWDGEAMRPRLPLLADRHYTVGESYRLVPHEDRSVRSHNHFFAELYDAFNNLPHELAERFPSAEHLRKYALIKGGYHDSRSIIAGSKAEAQRLAAFIRPLDDFAVVTVEDRCVTVYTAKSQNTASMGKKAFQESKGAVLNIVSAMIGVTRDQLAKNAENAA